MYKMAVRVLTVLVVLHKLSTFTLGEKLAGIYPDVTNCFKGMKREFEDDQVKSLHTPKDGCIAENPDENSLCYKVCMLQLRGMLRRLDYPNMDNLYREHFQQNSSSGHEKLDWTEVEKKVDEQRIGYNYTVTSARSMADITAFMLGVDAFYQPDEKIMAESNRIQQETALCEHISFMIPNQENKDCKDLDPKYHESMQKLAACVEGALKC